MTRKSKKIDGVTIEYIIREDGKRRVAAIIDPERYGGVRISKYGFSQLAEADEPYPEGIIVFGLYKDDRFRVSEVLAEYPEYKGILEKLKIFSFST